jgi:hypothetical protein
MRSHRINTWPPHVRCLFSLRRMNGDYRDRMESMDGHERG